MVYIAYFSLYTRLSSLCGSVLDSEDDAHDEEVTSRSTQLIRTLTTTSDSIRSSARGADRSLQILARVVDQILLEKLVQCLEVGLLQNRYNVIDYVY